MTLARQDVEKIAHLARLAVGPEGMDALAHDLNGILAFVEQMNGVDTSGVQAMAHPLHMAQRLRADGVTETDQRTLFQSIAPETEAGLYLVPKVIE